MRERVRHICIFILCGIMGTATGSVVTWFLQPALRSPVLLVLAVVFTYWLFSGFMDADEGRPAGMTGAVFRHLGIVGKERRR